MPTNTKAEVDRLLLCPRLRFVSAFAHSYVEEFRRAATEQARDLATSRALDLAKLVLWVVEPMARDLDRHDHADALHGLAKALTTLAGAHWQEHEVNFPPDDGRQLVLDKLDAIESKMNALLVHQAECRRTVRSKAIIRRLKPGMGWCMWHHASQPPDDDMTVLIALSDGEVLTGFMDAGDWRYVSGELVGQNSRSKVTHWAEFPAHPEKEAV